MLPGLRKLLHRRGCRGKEPSPALPSPRVVVGIAGDIYYFLGGGEDEGKAEKGAVPSLFVGRGHLQILPRVPGGERQRLVSPPHCCCCFWEREREGGEGLEKKYIAASW